MNEHMKVAKGHIDIAAIIQMFDRAEIELDGITGPVWIGKPYTGQPILKASDLQPLIVDAPFSLRIFPGELDNAVKRFAERKIALPTFAYTCVIASCRAAGRRTHCNWARLSPFGPA